MMANWGTIMFVLTAVPLSWMIESKGLRPTCLLVSGLIMVGAVIRNGIIREIFQNQGHIHDLASGGGGMRVFICHHNYIQNVRYTYLFFFLPLCLFAIAAASDSALSLLKSKKLYSLNKIHWLIIKKTKLGV